MCVDPGRSWIKMLKRVGDEEDPCDTSVEDKKVLEWKPLWFVE